MNIYFSTSISAMDAGFRRDCEKIIEAIKKQGHDVYPESFLLKTRDFYQKQSAEESLNEQRKLTAYKKNCGLVIFEASKPSLGIGQEISLSLLLERPVLVLYQKGCRPHLLFDMNSNNLIIAEYNHYTIDEVLNHAIEYATDFQPYRLNIILPFRLKKYLDWISRKSGITKSQFVRKLIHQHLNNNSQYDITS